MAVKMMTFGDLDKQFLDNNLLTAEDLQFDVTETLEETFKHNGLLDYFETDFEFSRHMPYVADDNPVNMMDESLINFLNTNTRNVQVKMEPLSPYSCSEASISQTEIPVLSIPDPPQNHDRLNIPDTPPHTPPNMSDVQISTPPKEISLETCISTNPMMFQSMQKISPNIPILQSVQLPDIKIKPKPLEKKNGGPLVLTADQFAMLTNGSLKVNSVCEISSTPNNNTKTLHPKSNAFTLAKQFSFLNKKSALKESGKHIHSIDLTAMKRQQRMIKNRESACLSRKKKKEYMQRLEDEVKEVSTINAKLQFENNHLKQQIGRLEKENVSLKTLNNELKLRISPNFVKKTTGLMAVLFMVTLNLAPLSNFLDKPITTDIQKTSSQRIGRTLLWEEHSHLDAAQSNSSKFSDLKVFADGNLSMDFMENMYSPLNVTMCPTYINRTESERLEKDLRGWVQRVEKKQKLKESLRNPLNKAAKKGLPPLPRLQSWIKKKNEIINHQHKKNEILVYHTSRATYEEFFDAINRRDDTFYFVSFSGDHLLLSATTHNQTIRPRMSLVMPALTFNESMGHMDDHIGMMQIDCEVMNTKLVYVKQSAIPEHLRQKSNSTSKMPMHKKSMPFPLNDKLHNFQRHQLVTRN